MIPVASAGDHSEFFPLFRLQRLSISRLPWCQSTVGSNASSTDTPVYPISFFSWLFICHSFAVTAGVPSFRSPSRIARPVVTASVPPKSYIEISATCVPIMPSSIRISSKNCLARWCYQISTRAVIFRIHNLAHIIQQIYIIYWLSIYKRNYKHLSNQKHKY